MNKKNSKKNLLKEEVNRFKNILENSFLFYEDNETEEPKEDLLLGNLYKEEEGGEEEPLEVSDEDINPPEEGEEPTDDLEDDSDDSEGFGDGEEGFGAEEPVDGSEMEPMDDAVELDVTELVKGSEEAKASADSANQKIDQLMGMINNLETQVSSMNSISTKIDSLENELEKRAPTPNEKLEMISIDSAPFNMRLGDFWKDQEGQYDVMSNGEKETEYVLDDKEIEKDYSDDKLKDSFTEKNEFEEEEF